MAKIFGVFGTKTCSFIKEDRAKNGPLVFRTVLCSKHDEKLGIPVAYPCLVLQTPLCFGTLFWDDITLFWDENLL